MLWGAGWLLAACGGRMDPTEAPPTPTEQVVPWVQVTWHPCAMNAEGFVSCWGDDPVGAFPNFDRRFAGAARTLVGNGAWTLFAHASGERLTEVYCDNPEAPACDPQEPLAMAGVGGGVTLDDALWVQNGPHFEQVLDSTRGRGWLVVSRGGNFGALDGENVVVGPGVDYSLYELQLPTDLEPVDLAVSYSVSIPDAAGPFGACVLDADARIGCYGSLQEVAVFDAPPYKGIQGGNGVVCAQRAADGVITCSDGSTFDLGEVVTWAAGVWPDTTVEPVEGYYPLRPSACGITVDNAIHCEGPLYTQQTLDRLAALPR